MAVQDRQAQLPSFLRSYPVKNQKNKAKRSLSGTAVDRYHGRKGHVNAHLPSACFKADGYFGEGE